MTDATLTTKLEQISSESEEIITLDTTRIDITTLLEPEPRWLRVRTRQALINRMKAANIEGEKGKEPHEDLRKTYIYGWQLEVLDDLDEFLHTTRLPLDSYSANWREEVAAKINSPSVEEVRRSPNRHRKEITLDNSQQIANVLAIAELLAELSPTFSQDNSLERLEKYAKNKWWNTGKAFGQMCGITYIPVNGYKAFGFKFTKVSPRSKWWRVEKLGESQELPEEPINEITAVFNQILEEKLAELGHIVTGNKLSSP